MENSPMIEDFINVLRNDFSVTYYEESQNYIVDARGLQATLSHSRLQEAINILPDKNEDQDTTIYDSNNFEILIKPESRDFSLLPIHRAQPAFVITDHENTLSYYVGYPSDTYLVFLLVKLYESTPFRSSSYNSMTMRRLMSSDRRDQLDFLDVLKSSMTRLYTLTIESEKKRHLNEFTNFANSFFFHLSYNLDIPIVPQRYLDEFVHRGRINRMRRSRIQELDAPKRIYESDLVYHFQQAVASESPSLGFLSYYHVLEHFFESVFEDTLINNVTDIITNPDFSYKRRKDIKNLIKQVQKSTKLQQDDITFSESEALKLTLEKWVNFNELTSQIRNYDESLIGYYRANIVSFSNGDTVNLENTNQSEIIRSLQNRIYKTRNSIVHSKEGEKARYKPFEHDKILVKEIPLLRFIAEQIIIATSKIM